VDTDTDTTGREIAGALMILGGLVAVVGTLVATLGWLAALVLTFGVGVSYTGYRLASTPASETDGETERDLGPGPLYVDPDDRDGLIPRQ
jgi:hypothetical protein